MSAALPFPGSRTLAGWWRQLAPLQPRSLWVGHLFVRRIEASANIRRRRAVDPLAGLLLQALSLETTGSGAMPARLAERLHLPEVLVGQLYRQLAEQGLARGSGHWQLTPAGQNALEHGSIDDAAKMRQVFSFVEQLDEAGRRLQPPHFLHIGESPWAETWAAAAGLPFDPAWLSACPAQDAAWKETFGFPAEVVEVLVGPLASDHADWQQVLVDRPEIVSVLLVEAADATWSGFALRPADWNLDLTSPLVRLSVTAFKTIFPAWQGETAPGSGQETWKAWCRTRNLPEPDTDACQTSLEGTSLRIRAPQRLVDQLRMSKSDLLKGDAWLLLGEGPCRRAVRLELAS